VGESVSGQGFCASRQKRYLVVETDSVKVVLNCRRGLAVDKLWLSDKDGEHLCGTLHHGAYDDISFGADFYTGHLVFEAPGRSKVTDLEPVEPYIQDTPEGVVVWGQALTGAGPVRKTLTIRKDQPCFQVEQTLDWDLHEIGSLRLGHLTLNPLAFDVHTLRFATHNGGEEREEFSLDGRTVLQGEAVSFLVSARAGVGMTQGRCGFSDGRKAVCLEFDPAQNAFLGLLTHQVVDSSFFTRLILSASEVDETRRGQAHLGSFKYALKAY
jgi:hypothetical protein